MRKSQRAQQQIATQLLQLSVSAPWVIAQRMTALALAGPGAVLNPSAESRRMVDEKVAASIESANAVAWSMARLPMTLLSTWMRAASMPPPRASAQAVGDALLTHSLDTTARALRPYAKRAKANASRLARRKK